MPRRSDVILFSPIPEPHSDSIADALAKRGVSVGRVDTRDLPASRLTLAYRGQDVGGTIRTAREGEFDLDAVGAFVGAFFGLDAPGIDRPAVRRFALDEWFQALLGLAAVTRDRLWVNPPEAHLLGESKLLQTRVAAAAGLATPEGLVSNDARDITAFAARYPDGVALKRVGHSFPRVAASTEPADEVLYTTRLTLAQLTPDALADAHAAPTHLQAYVEKASELRAYVVGDRVLAAEILSQDDDETREDWRRYPTQGGQVDRERWRCRAATLPARVEQALRRTVRDLGMNAGACDLIRTPQDEYVFLECNASGAFLFAEQWAGLPVSDAYADLVVAALH